MARPTLADWPLAIAGCGSEQFASIETEEHGVYRDLIDKSTSSAAFIEEAPCNRPGSPECLVYNRAYYQVTTIAYNHVGT